MDKRFGRVKWGPKGTRSRTSDANWKLPLRWNRKAEKAGERRRVFAFPDADVFEDWQGEIISHDGRVYWTDGKRNHTTAKAGNCMMEPFRKLTMDDLRRDLFALIDQTPHLDWLILTKRPENIRRMWTGINCIGDDFPYGTKTIMSPSGKPVTIGRIAAEMAIERGEVKECSPARSNVWLGCSLSTQADADKSIPELLKCADLCRVLFVSAEPLIEAVDLVGNGTTPGPIWHKKAVRLQTDYGTGIEWDVDLQCGIDLCIAGGESGPHARPCNLTWLRSLRDQCKKASVACFVKQLGSRPFEERAADDHLPAYARELAKKHGIGPLVAEVTEYRLKDSKGGTMEEWPADLRIREMPA